MRWLNFENHFLELFVHEKEISNTTLGYSDSTRLCVQKLTFDLISVSFDEWEAKKTKKKQTQRVSRLFSRKAKR